MGGGGADYLGWTICNSLSRWLGWAGLAGYLATCHLSDHVTQDGLSMNNNHRLTSHSLQNVTNKLSLQIGILTLSLVDMAGRIDCCILTFDLLNIVANFNLIHWCLVYYQVFTNYRPVHITETQSH